MKKSSIQCWVACALIAVVASTEACKKKDKPDAAAAAGGSESTLKGSSEVLASVDAKDYEKAMASWLAIRQTVSGTEQMTQFTLLTHELKTKLIAAANSDKKAADALASLRAVSAGR